MFTDVVDEDKKIKVLYGGTLSISSHGSFTPGEIALGVPLII
jgi:hypothetical protein